MKTNESKVINVKRVEPSDSWVHKKLWLGVRDALKALPVHFHSETFIEGVNATDVFTLNSALGATIENQVVETLNTIRSVWDPDNKYGACAFVRQPQSFPDVVLKNMADETSDPILGIELKGWYLLAKEAEPSMRFLQNRSACAEADLIMVVPWVLNSVISGRPRIFAPYIESARYTADYRNEHWSNSHRGDAAKIVLAKDAKPYPKKADATNDTVPSDKGGNFGRVARTGMMDEYLMRMHVQPVCGIKAAYWLEFFKIFHQDATDVDIRKAFDRLRKKVESIESSQQRISFLSVLSALEEHFKLLN